LEQVNLKNAVTITHGERQLQKINIMNKQALYGASDWTTSAVILNMMRLQPTGAVNGECLQKMKWKNY
jgi:hypothetical protein